MVRGHPETVLGREKDSKTTGNGQMYGQKIGHFEIPKVLKLMCAPCICLKMSQVLKCQLLYAFLKNIFLWCIFGLFRQINSAN